MPHSRSIVPGALVALALLLSAAPAAGQESLYRRMGGYDVIAAFVDDFFGRFDADPALAPYLGGLNAAAQGRVRQHFIDFICAETGGPCLYNGRDMVDAHRGLGIPPEHFDGVVRHMEAALGAQGVGSREASELLTALRATRPDVIGG